MNDNYFDFCTECQALKNRKEKEQQRQAEKNFCSECEIKEVKKTIEMCPDCR